jgi:hypothetical protein
MNSLDEVLPRKRVRGSFKKERELMKAVNIKFEAMEKQCKDWNQNGSDEEKCLFILQKKGL